MAEGRVPVWRIRERETRLHREALRHFLCEKLIEADRPWRGPELIRAKGWVVDFLCSQDWDEIAINRASLNKCGYIGCGRAIFGHERSLSHLALIMERRDIDADVFDSLCRASCLEAFLAVRAMTTTEQSYHRNPPSSLVDAYLAEGGSRPQIIEQSPPLVQEVDCDGLSCMTESKCADTHKSSYAEELLKRADFDSKIKASELEDDFYEENETECASEYTLRDNRFDSCSSFKSVDSCSDTESVLPRSVSMQEAEGVPFFSYGASLGGTSLLSSDSVAASIDARPSNGALSHQGSNVTRSTAVESPRKLRSILTSGSGKARGKKSISFGPDTKPGDEGDTTPTDNGGLESLFESEGFNLSLDSPWQSVMSWMISWTTLNTTAYLLAEREEDQPAPMGNETSTTAESDDDFYDPVAAGDMATEQLPRQTAWRQALLNQLSGSIMPQGLAALWTDLRHLVHTFSLNNIATTIQPSEGRYLLALLLLLLCSNDWASLTSQQKEKRETTVRRRLSAVDETELWCFVRRLLEGVTVDQALERWRLISDVAFDP